MIRVTIFTHNIFDPKIQTIFCNKIVIEAAAVVKWLPELPRDRDRSWVQLLQLQTFSSESAVLKHALRKITNSCDPLTGLIKLSLQIN